MYSKSDVSDLKLHILFLGEQLKLNLSKTFCCC